MSDYNPNQKDLYHYYVEMGFDEDFDFVGTDGEPIFMDYRTVDWQGLSAGIRDLMEGVPESVGFFVANEPIDVSDSNAEKQDRSCEALSGAMNAVFSLIEPGDYQDGVLDLAQYRHILHPIKFPPEAAPPAIGLILAVRASISEMADVEAAVCRPFGHSPILQGMVADEGAEGNDPCIESMDPALHRLLVEHLGLPYKRQCAMSFLVRRPA